MRSFIIYPESTGPGLLQLIKERQVPDPSILSAHILLGAQEKTYIAIIINSDFTSIIRIQSDSSANPSFPFRYCEDLSLTA